MSIGSFSWIIPNLIGAVGAFAIMDSANPRWLWVVIFGVGTLATVGFLFLFKMTKKRFAEMMNNQDQKSQPVEAETIEIIKDSSESEMGIKPTSEELPEVEVRS